ncbi:MAG: lipopolysaccharide assembly protein LapA domain-containing protein [Planktothrix sp.]
MPNAPAIVTSFILAFWMSAIAILAIQNATPISLRFLFLESVQLPVGVLLAFSVSLGLLSAALFKPIAQLGLTPQNPKIKN